MAAPNGTEIALGLAGSSAIAGAVALPMLSDYLQMALFGAGGAFIGCALRKDLMTIGAKATSAFAGLFTSLAFSWIAAIFISAGTDWPVQIALHPVSLVIAAVGDLWVRMIPKTLNAVWEIMITALKAFVNLRSGPPP